LDIKLPKLMIVFGPPFRTIERCIFPALDCPLPLCPPRPKNTNMVVGPAPEPSTEPPVIEPNDPNEPDEDAKKTMKTTSA
jgi:hypothetical protein